MKKKIIMTIALSISLLTMFLYWFGGIQGAQSVSGVLMFNNPIAITCIILAFIGIWTNYGRNSEIIGSIGMIGIIAMEIYELLTWHIIDFTGHFDIGLSFSLAYPEFWVALICISGTYIFFKITNKHEDLT